MGGQHFLSFRDLVSSTGVNHSVKVRFTSPTKYDLLLARRNRLELYRILSVAPMGSDPGNVFCVLHESWEVAGDICDMVTVPVQSGTKYSQDAVLLVFKPAKMSLVAYDEQSGQLKSIALRNFEQGSIGPGTNVQAQRLHNKFQVADVSEHLQVRMDMQARCASMVAYNDQLIVVPFRHTSNEFQDVEEDDMILEHQQILGGFESEIIQRPFVINLREIGISGRVIDFAFLNGYTEPTLMILHEVIPSCNGRFAVGRDTYSLTVLSINVTHQLYPKIWSVEGLPLNSLQIVPVPEPIGGAFVLCTNAFLYFNQTQFAGVSLNAGFGPSTLNSVKLPLESNPVPLQMKLSEFTPVVFLDPTELVFCQPDGGLHMLQLNLGSTSKQKLSVVNLDTKTLPCSCICALENNMIFLGSTSGDSLLIGYQNNFNKEQVKSESGLLNGLPAKRQKVSSSGEFADSGGPVECESDDDEDMLLYGSSQVVKKESIEVKKPMSSSIYNGDSANKYEFRVLDSFFNLGQITSMDRGLSLTEDESQINAAEQFDLVVAGGFGSSGSVSVVNRGLRPIVGTEAELTGCRAMWTVKDIEGETNNTDAYLILSIGSGTMILSTAGDAMEPLDVDEAPGFYINGATLAAGNLFHGKMIAQVSKQGVRLIHNLKCIQELTIEDDIGAGGLGMGLPGLTITLVDVLDPYILLCLSDGSIRIVRGDSSKFRLTAEAPLDELAGKQKKTFTNQDGVTSATLFCDYARVFDNSNAAIEKKTSENEKNMLPTVLDVEDDDDDALYGSASTPQAQVSNPLAENKPLYAEGVTENSLLDQSDAQSHAAICRESGVLEIYSLPDFNKVGEFPNFAFGPLELVNTIHNPTDSASLGLGKEADRDAGALGAPPAVADIAIHRVGPESTSQYSSLISKMVLVALLTTGDLLMYEARPQIKGVPVFRRVKCSIITRPLAGTHGSLKNDGRGGKSTSVASSTDAGSRVLKNSFRYPMFSRFCNISGRSGLFFRGIRPCWIFCDRGKPQIVPMDVSDSCKPNAKVKSVPVLCFSPFHNQSSPDGFMYFHSTGSLRICQLPPAQEVSLTADGGGLAVRKIPIKSTPHTIVYLGNKGTAAVAEALETPTYIVIVSNKKVWIIDEDEEEDALPPAPQPEDMQMEANEKPKDVIPLDPKDLGIAPPVLEDCYELRLIQANTWDPAGVFQLEFERYEVVLAVKLMYLSDTSLHPADSDPNEEWKKRRRPYVVIGTGFVTPAGEDGTGRGRLLLYEVDYAQYTDDTGVAGAKVPKLNLVYKKEHRSGAISVVDQMGPYVVASIGSKLIVHELKTRQLVGCAFYDAQMFLVSMNCVKDYIVYGDIYKSVHLLRWSDFDRSLTLLAKDFNPLNVSATEFSINDKHLGIVAADENRNFSIYHFAPNEIQSRGGQRLLLRNDFHVGTVVNCMKRYRIPPSVIVSSKTQQRFATLCASNSGGIGLLTPISERIFRRLYALQTILTNALPQAAGMNPREYRQFRHGGVPNLRQCQKGCVDISVLRRYISLDLLSQKELARCIGTTPDTVIQNLLEIDLAASFF